MAVLLFGVPFLRPPRRSPGLDPAASLFLLLSLIADTALITDYPVILTSWHRLTNLALSEEGDKQTNEL
jgi:hypothetical protein